MLVVIFHHHALPLPATSPFCSSPSPCPCFTPAACGPRSCYEKEGPLNKPLSSFPNVIPIRGGLPPSSSDSKKLSPLSIGLIIGVCVLIVAILCILFFTLKKKKHIPHSYIEN